MQHSSSCLKCHAGAKALAERIKDCPVIRCYHPNLESQSHMLGILLGTARPYLSYHPILNNQYVDAVYY